MPQATVDPEKIIEVQGDRDRGFVVKTRDETGAVTVHLVPPDDAHPDFRTAAKYRWR